MRQMPFPVLEELRGALAGRMLTERGNMIISIYVIGIGNPKIREKMSVDELTKFWDKSNFYEMISIFIY